jgi:hypothetical protein
MADLNAIAGNKLLNKITSHFWEIITNKKGIRLTNFTAFHNLSIMITFYSHEDIHKFAWSAVNSRLIINYLIANA